MKKALVLGALASLGALSFGCVLTDYEAAPGQAPFVGVNKSHGLLGCQSDDRIANAQQTIESSTRNLVYTSTFGAGAGPNCPTGFNPGLTSNNISNQDARDWNRFIGPYVFFGEAQVFGTGGGTYILAGAKDLADGNIRLNSYASAAVGNFSCVGSAVNGMYGGPEGQVASAMLTERGDAAPRIPGLAIDAIALDNRLGAQFCPNIVAVNSDRITALGGYSTYWGLLGRTAEGRLRFTPVTRRDGLAGFFAGEQITTTVGGVDFTVSGQLNADGTVRATLEGMAADGVQYVAGENKVWFEVDPSNNFRTVAVHAEDRAELARLAEFALNAGLTDRNINLGGQVVPEFGVQLPNAQFLLNGDAFRQFINDVAAGNGDGGGIGG